MTDALEPLFLFGPGFSATALAKIWPGKVYGSVRSEQSLDKLKGSTIKPVRIDDAVSLKNAVQGAHLLISVPPDQDGCPALRSLGDIAARAASVTYLSTTGVYGDLQGGWAMEWTSPNPQSARAERRVRAEQLWLNVDPRLKTVRLPGIYGPGRSAFERLNNGTARRIVKPGQVFSRCHVDDIARGVFALIEAGESGVFHLCDEEAAPPQDVITYAADLLGATAPPKIAFKDAELSPMARSFYGECKRVSNAKVKAATGWRPLYPTYREGLRSIFDQMG